MPELPILNLEKREMNPVMIDDPTGLDPVSGPALGAIVAGGATRLDNFYSKPSGLPVERGSDFTPMTWVMIVIAGVALGFAVALMLAGA